MSRNNNRFHRLWLRNRWIKLINIKPTCRLPPSVTWPNFVLVQIRHFAMTSLLFIAAGAYSRSFCEFLGVANVNTFLSLNQMKPSSFSNCFEQISLEWRFASVASLASVSLVTSNPVTLKKWSVWQTIDCATSVGLFGVLNDESVAGRSWVPLQLIYLIHVLFSVATCLRCNGIW